MTITREPWSCGICGAPGVRNIGISGWCPVHLAELYATFDPAVFQVPGVGLQVGQAHRELGPLHADLCCTVCGATWVGVVGEPCMFCEARLTATRDHQRELLLRPPDVRREARNYEAVMRAWLDRLTTGYECGLIERNEALNAYRVAASRAA